MKHSKITIIGAGAVGSTTAYAILLKNIATEIILVDIDQERCKGEILDLSDALSFDNASKIKSGTVNDATESDIIIIAAGNRQKPGESRIDLIENNKQIINSIFNQIKTINPTTIIIMITNPVDILTFYTQKIVKLPKTQIFGSGTFLDTERLRGFISQKIGISKNYINAFVLGEHGDTQFPAWSTAHVGGILLKNFEQINENDFKEIAEKTRIKAYEIISCKGATFYGIASCIATICKSILFDQKLLIPLSCYIPKLEVCLSMPTILGKNGIDYILSIPLDKKEEEKLYYSAQQLKKYL